MSNAIECVVLFVVSAGLCSSFGSMRMVWNMNVNGPAPPNPRELKKLKVHIGCRVGLVAWLLVSAGLVWFSVITLGLALSVLLLVEIGSLTWGLFYELRWRVPGATPELIQLSHSGNSWEHLREMIQDGLRYSQNDLNATEADQSLERAQQSAIAHQLSLRRQCIRSNLVMIVVNLGLLALLLWLLPVI